MDTSDELVDRFLEILADAGVTTAELRRLYGCRPDEDLETAVRRELEGDRTSELLRALETTDRSFDLKPPVTADVGESLAAALDRYGYSIDASADGSELEIVAFDAVTNDIHRFRSTADPDSFRETLDSALLERTGLTSVALVDGSTLVADRRAIDRLRSAYGDRIAPFGRPILRPESGDGRAPDAAAGRASAADDVEPATDPSVDPGTAGGTRDADDAGAAAVDDTAADRGFDEFSAAFEDGRRHVGADGEDRPVATSATSEPASEPGTEANSEPGDFEVRGGPRTAVSAAGIDDVFAELEATRRNGAGDSDADAGSLAGSEPRTTVSDTSADDILAQATGETTFDEVAARAGEADPDAILEEGDDVLVEDARTAEADER